MIEKIEKFGAEKFGLALKEISAISVILFLTIIALIYQYFNNENLSEEKKKSLIAVLDSLSNANKNFNSFAELDNYSKKNELKEKSDRFRNLKIDIKTASNLELMKLPNIGKATAEDIIEYRNKFGFKSNRDLLNVKGIGEKTYQKIEKYLTEEDTSLSKKINIISNNNNFRNDTIELVQNKSKEIIKINLNTASIDELMSLEGIGEVTAKKIIEYRSNNKFEKIEDLMKIKGISNKKFENVKKFIEIR